MAEDELGSIVEYSEDITNAEAPDPLPPGDYEAEVKGAEQRIGVNTGKKYAAVQFYIPVDQYPADYVVENNPDGVIITFRRVSLEDTARGRHQARRFCEAIGAPTGKRLDLNEWVNLTARVGVQNEVYEGLNREVITKVSAL